jgi:primary-amine oxidase
VDEVIELEQLCLKHPKVIAEIENLQLPKGVTVCTDPWIYGAESDSETRRLTQFYMYLVNNHPESNHYSHPLKFSPVFDATTKDLVRIDYLPSGADSTTTKTQPWKPVETVEFADALLTEPKRTDLKPYIVQQPEGPSFSVQDENMVSWQKWRFRVRSTYREGLVLQNVTYDGRNVLYRLAVSEMSVPYAGMLIIFLGKVMTKLICFAIDPRAPYHRKQAFDAGDVGFGATANQLSLGCDCLGHINYLNSYRADSRGNPLEMKNIICIHEQDAGLLFKHTNYRTEYATVVRNRQLVVQMICTLANYEYIFAYIFDQAGSIETEVRATGILSTMPVDEGVTVPWGTNVSPNAMAPNHQHMFSLRIDPAIDGYNNTVFYEESIPMPIDPVLNPYGVGYVAQPTVVKKAGSATLDSSRNRVFKIRNDHVINEISKKPVAYSIHAANTQMLIAGPNTYHQRRAQFATKPFWFTKHQEDELFAAGEFTNQCKDSTGVELWSARAEDVEDSDVVIWHSKQFPLHYIIPKSNQLLAFGLTHNPRPEDFPVMPCEKISVTLKPSGFFTKNPALDVPQSTQNFNKSTLDEAGTAENTGNASCCSTAPKL